MKKKISFRNSGMHLTSSRADVVFKTILRLMRKCIKTDFQEFIEKKKFRLYSSKKTNVL